MVSRKEQLSQSMETKALLENHRLHLGLYKRVADAVGVHASFVSKVASGKRESIPVMRVLLKELRKLEQQSFANGRHNDDPSAEVKGLNPGDGSGERAARPTSWNTGLAS